MQYQETFKAYMAGDALDDDLKSPDRYSPHLSLLCAILSDLAYQPIKAETLNETLAALECKFVKGLLDKKPGTQGFVAIHNDNKFAVIAYRGSEKKFRDWATDLEIKLDSDGAGNHLHRGFREAVENTSLPANAAIGDDIPVLLCGHSLGGALAAMHAVTTRSKNMHAIYTIGQPRIGRIDPANQLSGLGYFRIVNDADIVPRVPYAVMGYRHFGALVRCDHPLPLSAVIYEDTQKTAADEIRKYLNDKHRERLTAISSRIHGWTDQALGWLGMGKGNSEPPDVDNEEKNALRKMLADIAEPAADHSAAQYVDQLGRDVT